MRTSLQDFPHHGKNAVRAAVEAIELDLLLWKEPNEPGDPEPPKQSMLGKLQKVLAATKDLRTQRGRLSAKLIADVYDQRAVQLMHDEVPAGRSGAER
jgi:hypothetical protein